MLNLLSLATSYSFSSSPLQRVVPENTDISPPSGSAAFDYLYEFSETRKVLEEFFRCPTNAGQPQINNLIANDEIVNFQVSFMFFFYYYNKLAESANFVLPQ